MSELCTVGANRLTYVGHATVMVDLDGVRLLTDPVLRNRVLHLRRHSTHVALKEVADLDAILISHLHGDHLDPPSLRRLKKGTKIVAPAGSSGFLRRRGLPDVIELAPGETTSVRGLDVTGIAVAHEGRRYPLGRSIQTLGYDIRGTSRIFFAGDTAHFDVGGLAGADVALLPIAGWGPRIPLADHLDPAAAARLAADLQPRMVVPIHWGTLLRLGLGKRADELIHRPAREFAKTMAEVAPEVAVRVLSPGASIALPPAS